VSICVRAGLPKPRLVPDNERIKDTKTLDYASTPLDANTLLCTCAAVDRYLTTRMPVLWLRVGMCGTGIGVVGHET
jgi:hypothetical protein